jgi:hypothetical protein
VLKAWLAGAVMQQVLLLLLLLLWMLQQTLLSTQLLLQELMVQNLSCWLLQLQISMRKVRKLKDQQQLSSLL